MFLRGASLAQPAVDATITVRPFVGVAPDTVTDLTALPGTLEGSVALSWTAPAVYPGSTLDSYQLRVQTFSVADVGGSTTVWWNNATGAQFLVQSFYGVNPSQTIVRVLGPVPADHVMALVPGVSYYFAVRSADDMGTGRDFWSGSSNHAAAIAKSRTLPPEPPVLSAVVVSSITIRWVWTAPGSAATSFGFYYSTGSLLATLSGSASFYLEANLSTSTSYSRYVVAKNSMGQAQSSTNTVVTPSQKSFIVGTDSGTLNGA